MSTISDSGSSTTTNAMLDAMDDKLKALNPLREKVTALEASADELGAQ
jgi:hypothetical protein